MLNKTAGFDINGWSIATCNEKLLEARKKILRNSEYISLISSRILTLNPNFSKIQDKHAALEQCIMAAIDNNEMVIAKKLFSLIDNDFPKDKSNRSQKLHLMLFEKNSLPEVLEQREDMLKEDDTDQILLKRNIATLISENNIEEAVSKLCGHLETFQCDDDSWLCLSDLYIELGHYSRASFCLEEIVMKNPHTAHYHIRLAEIYYTWAALENNNLPKDQILDLFNCCKFHYAHSIRLTLKCEIPNLRALLGWMQASKAVNNLRNIKNIEEAKAINRENQTMRFMGLQIEKYDVSSLNQGGSTSTYLENLMQNLKVDRD